MTNDWNDRNLVSLRDYGRDGNINLDNIQDPRGQTAYDADHDKIGTVRDVMVEPTTGRIRYLSIDGGGFINKKVYMIPVGLTRMEDDGIHIDNIDRDRIGELSDHDDDTAWTTEHQARDHQVMWGNEATMTEGRYDYRDNDESNRNFRAGGRLQLLEERLRVDKVRERVGEVEVGKRVETRQENVNVDLHHDEVVITRHQVNEARPVSGNASFGADSERIRVDLEAERADVRKEAFVAEEIEVGKRDVSEQRTFNETLRREDVEVRRDGDVNLIQDGAHVDNDRRDDRDR